ncbi:MAG: DUF3014 domain-containing protein [Gemmatimonadota bacterium]
MDEGQPTRSPRGDDALFPGLRRRRGSRNRTGAIVGAVVVLLLAAGGIWYWLESREVTPTPDGGAPTAGELTPDADTLPEGPDLDLPPLDTSDEFIRNLVAGLSEHPQFARWLVTDELAHRFVTSVVNVAGGSTPVSQVPFLVPDEDFAVRETNEGPVIDPASYRRYDLLAETFVSIDTQGTARLYRGLHPLFEEAYGELGLPDRTFDETLAVAIGNLLAVEVPDRPMRVVRGEGIIYEFTDPSIEGLSHAQRHMYRLGPQNARRVQEKLRELADALGIDPQPAGT